MLAVAAEGGKARAGHHRLCPLLCAPGREAHSALIATAEAVSAGSLLLPFVVYPCASSPLKSGVLIVSGVL